MEPIYHNLKVTEKIFFVGNFNTIRKLNTIIYHTIIIHNNMDTEDSKRQDII